jgi:RNase H-fold protein (predicted Holliday junction resolvase)
MESSGKACQGSGYLYFRTYEKISLPVHRVDERLTSVAAAESIQRKPKGKRGKRPSDGRIDATAASLILRDFLEGKGI